MAKAKMIKCIVSYALALYHRIIFGAGWFLLDCTKFLVNTRNNSAKYGHAHFLSLLTFSAPKIIICLTERKTHTHTRARAYIEYSAYRPFSKVIFVNRINSHTGAKFMNLIIS